MAHDAAAMQLREGSGVCRGTVSDKARCFNTTRQIVAHGYVWSNAADSSQGREYGFKSLKARQELASLSKEPLALVCRDAYD